ncbi:MAG: DUF1772 domain-containing protein [Deinococcota bacterium]
MITRILFQNSLMLATLLTTLVTGFILLFAIVVMPGLGKLPAADFLRAFQVMDRVIQNNQPLFMVVWVGSVVTLLMATVLGFSQLGGVARLLLVGAAVSFIVGTQAPTRAVNIPLNNHLQTLTIDGLPEQRQMIEREQFERRWNRWNVIRTIFASSSSVLLIVVLRMV